MEGNTVAQLKRVGFAVAFRDGARRLRSFFVGFLERGGRRFIVRRFTRLIVRRVTGLIVRRITGSIVGRITRFVVRIVTRFIPRRVARSVERRVERSFARCIDRCIKRYIKRCTGFFAAGAFATAIIRGDGPGSLGGGVQRDVQRSTAGCAGIAAVGTTGIRAVGTAGTRAARTAGTRAVGAAGTRAVGTAGSHAVGTAGTPALRTAGLRAARTAGTGARRSALINTGVEGAFARRRTADGFGKGQRIQTGFPIGVVVDSQARAVLIGRGGGPCVTEWRIGIGNGHGVFLLVKVATSNVDTDVAVGTTGRSAHDRRVLRRPVVDLVVVAVLRDAGGSFGSAEHEGVVDARFGLSVGDGRGVVLLVAVTGRHVDTDVAARAFGGIGHLG
ncbi:hypothetical protein D3C80_1161370 [compost metagenome]